MLMLSCRHHLILMLNVVKLMKLNIKRPNNLINEWAEDLNIDIFESRYTDGQQEREKMLNITNHQRNANLNHNKI